MSAGIETDGVDPADLEWLSLDGDEEIVWAGGPDRRTLIPAFAIGIPLAIVLIGIVIIASEYLRVTNTHYVVTNRALYAKTGVLSRDVKRIEHEKVQDISYSQSALGAHFGYGNVEVSTAGGSGVEMAFKSVPDPKAVQRTISERVDRNRGEPADGHSSEDTLAAILTELRAIREAVGDDRSVRANGGDADRSNDGTAGRSDDRTADRKDDRRRNEYDTDESV
ncbi:PH domain-containing protein [Natrinema sp. DC36]|uniref:PH domain-containing protein n=1 Tax=Natrinema sp. DC36 TaxID=2878680 RepID=UPI001CF0B596|nr:PH domain-containing protein [Natrinema sp. DC36]